MRIEFLLKAEKLPIIYRHRFLALIKEALSISDNNLKDYLYPPENSAKSKMAKPFSFAVKLPKSKEIRKEFIKIDKDLEIEEEVFHLSSNPFLRFFVTSYDYNFVVSLYNGMITLKEFELFEGIKAEIVKVYLLKDKKISQDNVRFKTLSPVLVEDKEEKPILPLNGQIENFNEQLNKIEGKIKNELLKTDLKRKLKLTPLKIKKEIVKLTIREKRKEKPFFCFTPFSGTFEVEGDPEDLNFLYQKGIGLRTGQGFGMVEIL